MKIKLSNWAKKNSMTYSGAYKLFKLGKIPGASQLDSGTILIEEQGSVQCAVKCRKTGREFLICITVDLESSGLQDDDKADILNATEDLGAILAKKLGYDV